MEPKNASMLDQRITGDELSALVQIASEATSAFIKGDMRRYLSLIEHADDYTLMTPFGGETVRGFDNSDEYIASLERFFGGGEATFELIETYTADRLAVLVAIERQHGKVGDLPEQDWSLRITLVFRRENDRWLLVHRHADPLVHPISFSQLSVLARG